MSVANVLFTDHIRIPAGKSEEQLRLSFLLNKVYDDGSGLGGGIQ